jgi:hypothetical protein
VQPSHYEPGQAAADRPRSPADAPAGTGPRIAAPGEARSEDPRREGETVPL